MKIISAGRGENRIDKSFQMGWGDALHAAIFPVHFGTYPLAAGVSLGTGVSLGISVGTGVSVGKRVLVDVKTGAVVVGVLDGKTGNSVDVAVRVGMRVGVRVGVREGATVGPTA